MLALLQAPILRAKYETTSIPHYRRRPVQDFKKLLDGKPLGDDAIEQPQRLQIGDGEHEADGNRLLAIVGNAEEGDEHELVEDLGYDLERDFEAEIDTYLESVYQEEARQREVEEEEQQAEDPSAEVEQTEEQPGEGEAVVGGEGADLEVVQHDSMVLFFSVAKKKQRSTHKNKNVNTRHNVQLLRTLSIIIV